ncbi:MAG: hypothetical protein Q4E66_05930, partial [Comamonadaceae bacterium]|nr:hypothetical protein [Comamonadaceae bacterium]
SRNQDSGNCIFRLFGVGVSALLTGLLTGMRTLKRRASSACICLFSVSKAPKNLIQQALAALFIAY